MFLPGIGLALAAFLLSIMSPGPNILAILGTSMSVGRKPGVAVALGVATGSFCWAAVTAAGLSVLLAAYAVAITAIKIAGGAYLLWLAYKSFRAAATRQDMQTRTLNSCSDRLARYYLRGLTIQMTNPKAVLAWIAIISLGLQPGAPFWVAATIVLGAGVLSAIIHCVYAMAFSSAPMLRAYGRTRRWIQAALGAFFGFAGMKLLLSRT